MHKGIVIVTEYNALFLVERKPLPRIVYGAYAVEEGAVHVNICVELGEQRYHIIINLGHGIAAIALVEG